VNATLECVVCFCPALLVSVAVTSPTPRSVLPAAGVIFSTCTPTVRRAGFAFVDEAWLLDTASAATIPIAAAAESNPIWIRLGTDGMLPLLILPPFEGRLHARERRLPLEPLPKNGASTV
jgi:hypothetical protein